MVEDPTATSFNGNRYVFGHVETATLFLTTLKATYWFGR